MIEVYLETGRRRTFAMTRSWPGWGRSATTADAALESLAAYHPRYLVIAEQAGHTPPPPQFDVVETVKGGGATDFGVPDRIPGIDRAATDAEDLLRQIHLFEAAHAVFEVVVAAAPEQLRKGPRGGGRDTSAIVDHVVESERSYLRSIGTKPGDGPVDAVRSVALERCRELVERPEDTRWPLPYFLRRATWHVVDHLWEIEDRR